MSTYDELQVYKIAYDLTIHTFTFTEKIKRSFKYTLGEKMNLNVIDLLLSIYKANSRKDERYAHLQKAQLRIAKDLQIMTINRFVVLNEMVESISKQIYGWKQSASYQKKPLPAVSGKLF